VSVGDHADADPSVRLRSRARSEYGPLTAGVKASPVAVVPLSRKVQAVPPDDLNCTS
jgi:hypothetical protein